MRAFVIYQAYNRFGGTANVFSKSKARKNDFLIVWNEQIKDKCISNNMNFLRRVDE